MLDWSLRFSEHESTLNKIKKRSGALNALDDKPELDPELFFVWELFSDLSNSRSVGFDVNPISITDMVSMFDLYDLDNTEKLEYFHVIHEMDKVWLKTHEK